MHLQMRILGIEGRDWPVQLICMVGSECIGSLSSWTELAAASLSCPVDPAN